MRYNFDNELIEGLIKSRPNRFIMFVEINNHIFKCHCPSTGRIGNVEFGDIPCLVSEAKNKNRKTPYTVEAISLDSIEKKNKKWIGINQTRINRYVEFFLKENKFKNMVYNTANIQREYSLGNSRIDFKINKDFLEVKMPLIAPFPGVKNRKIHSKFNSFDRLIKHFADLTNNLNKNSRAIILLCYMYEAKPFVPLAKDKNNEKVIYAAKKANNSGVETWQANFKIDKRGVELTKYFKLELFQ